MRIFVWPDGSWMRAEEHCDTIDRWKGNDFLELNVDSYYEEEDIDAAAMAAVSWR